MHAFYRSLSDLAMLHVCVKLSITPASSTMFDRSASYQYVEIFKGVAYAYNII